MFGIGSQIHLHDMYWEMLAFPTFRKEFSCLARKCKSFIKNVVFSLVSFVSNAGDKLVIRVTGASPRLLVLRFVKELANPLKLKKLKRFVEVWIYGGLGTLQRAT